MATKEQSLREKLQKKVKPKWRVQSLSRKTREKNGTLYGKASCIAYIDAREVMDILDDAIGIENWKDEYKRDSNGQLQCTLSLKINGEWIGKTDVGTVSQTESEKGEYSDAFKRAAVKWNIGRYLYDLKIQWINCVVTQYNGKNKFSYAVDDNGSKVWDISELINK